MNSARHEPMELELRVLAGPQVGARAPVTRDAEWRIGGGPAALADPGKPAPDILLHSIEGFAIQVAWPQRAEPARLTVLEGEARLGAQVLAAGAAHAWAMGQLLSLGAVMLAYGPASVDVWLDEPVEKPAASAPAAAASTARVGIERWLLGAGVGLAVACIGLFGLVELMTPARPANASAVLPLSQPVAARHDADALARQVADVFRLHGVAAEAEPRADGGVLVQARERDSWRVEQAEKAVRRDVPGLPSLTVRNQPPATPVAARAPLEPDAGKRITSVVDNADAPFFVTADGSRYFVGALLPSGHRVLLIADKTVTVERDGQLTKLTL